jgi:hypothetical protein
MLWNSTASTIFTFLILKSNFTMINFKQFLTIVILAFTISTDIHAQMEKGDVGYQGGTEVAFPTGILGDLTSFGIGGFGQISYALTDQVHLNTSFGYNIFIGKGEEPNTFGQYSIKAGGAYFLGNDGGFNVNGSVGYGSVTSNGFGEGGLHYAFGAGYDFEMLKVHVNYNGIAVKGGAYTWVGLRLAYPFGY